MELITYDWLEANGFRRLERSDRQPTDHMRRCLGGELIGERWLTASEDVCLDVAPSSWPDPHYWFCWLTRASRQNHHPSVWVHVRHLRYTAELELLYSAITGRQFGLPHWDSRKLAAPIEAVWDEPIDWTREARNQA